MSAFAPNTVLDECESTNDLARSLGESGAPNGSWVSARRQTRGRGRLGRTWQSLEGNLFLSIVARVEPISRWTWVPIATAVGIAEAIEEFLGIRLQVKWPNDLWRDGEKCGGILCESSVSPSNPFIVIGVGLNCAVAPDGLDRKTTALGTTADQVRGLVVESILRQIAGLEAKGPEALIAGYRRYQAFPPGTRVQWRDSAGIWRGKVLGLGDSGELRVDRDGLGPVALYAEDVSFVPGEAGESPAE